MAKLEGGGTEVSLVRTPVEMGMDEKLAALINHVTEHPRVVSVELQVIKFLSDVVYLSDHRLTQGVQLGQCHGMPLSLEAIVKLLRTRRIPFLGLTGTGLDDLDGLMLAGALTRLSNQASLKQVPSEETSLDLTQIATAVHFAVTAARPPAAASSALEAKP